MAFTKHESQMVKSHDWLTPCWILDALGSFDLDPCASLHQPWATAARHYTVEHDGLSREWTGRVWLNPPYGKDVPRWLSRMAEHGNGTALVFARCDTSWFQQFAPTASLLHFIRGRVPFHAADGTLYERTGGGAAATAPSVLLAWGERDADILLGARIPGFKVRSVAQSSNVVGVNPTTVCDTPRQVRREALTRRE